MITVYIVEEDGTIVSKVIEKSQLLSYKNLGWTEEKPVDFAGAIADTDRKVDIPFGGGTDTTPSPFGYPSLVPDGQGGFIDVNVYLNGLNDQGQWYYPGDEDRVLDGMSVQDIRTLQDRLVRTQWLSTEDCSQEYGRPSTATRNSLIKAMTARVVHHGQLVNKLDHVGSELRLVYLYFLRVIEFVNLSEPLV